MITKQVVIGNRAGIHARPAAMIVKVANKFKSDITLSKDDDEIFIQPFSNNYTWIDIDCGCAMGSEFGYLACLRIDETDGQIKEVIYMR